MLTGVLLASGAALAVAQGGPGLTALAPVRRLFPRLAGAGRPDHVALTFDDGPDPRFTPRLLATLDARRIHATFFLLGPMAQAAPGLAAEIASAGHEIAVHGWEHRYATVRGPRALHDDLARACDTIAGGDRRRAPAVPAAVRGAQRRRPDRRAPSRVAADSVEFLGTGVGPGGHAGISAGDAGQHPGRRGDGAAARFRGRGPRRARPRLPWVRCPGCWTSAPAAGCGQAHSPGIWRTVCGRMTTPCSPDEHRAQEMTPRADHRGSAEVKAVLCGK